MTSKVTNFIKQYFFMLVLAATFVGFSAFKVSNITNTALEQFYWYEVDDLTNEITDTQINPAALCDDGPNICAVGFSDDHYTVGPGMPAPISDVDQLETEDPEGYQIALKD